MTVNKPEQDIDVNQLYEAIKYGYIEEEIGWLRKALNKKDIYDTLKRQLLPCVTISGTFGYRNASGLIKHSGLLQVDIDKVPDYKSVFEKICNDMYTYLCFRSPGGQGIKVIVRINANPETHKDQFESVREYYLTNFGIEIDGNCKDIARAMLLSCDPDIFCNPHTRTYTDIKKTVTNVEVKTSARHRTTHRSRYKDDDIDLIEQITRELEIKHIDITDSYDKWVRVGFALCSALGESGRSYFHRISQMYPRYNQQEADKFYTGLLKKNDGRITIGTLVFMAKEGGIDTHNY